MEQAKRYAGWLAKYLREAIGREITVVPTVSLPGWFVDRAVAHADVRVFAPAGKGAHFMLDQNFGPPLDEGVRSLIAQALVMRYPDATQFGSP